MPWVFELYSAPIGGGASPVKLNSPLSGGQDVGPVGAEIIKFVPFQISPDSGRVVYFADLDVDDGFDLFSAPIDGSAAPVELASLLFFGSAISHGEFRISPDSSRVVHHVPAGLELYSVPIDGSASGVRLNAPLVAGGNVGAGQFRISPDSSRVVYNADQQVDERFELFSVPIDASASPVRLNAPLVAGGDVGSLSSSIDAFEIGPGGSRVVYMADQDANDRLELYGVPIDASAAPTRLNGPLIPDGDIRRFELGSGGILLYLADQEADNVDELYVNILIPSHDRPAATPASTVTRSL